MGLGVEKGKGRVLTGSGSILFLLLCLPSSSLSLLSFCHPSWPVHTLFPLLGRFPLPPKANSNHSLGIF